MNFLKNVQMNIPINVHMIYHISIHMSVHTNFLHLKKKKRFISVRKRIKMISLISLTYSTEPWPCLIGTHRTLANWRMGLFQDPRGLADGKQIKTIPNLTQVSGPTIPSISLRSQGRSRKLLGKFQPKSSINKIKNKTQIK